MNDLDRFLGSGSDAPVPSDLTSKIQASINGAVDAAPSPEPTSTSEAAVVPAASSSGPGVLAWVAGIIIVGVLIAVLVPGGEEGDSPPARDAHRVEGGSAGGGGSTDRRSTGEGEHSTSPDRSFAHTSNSEASPTTDDVSAPPLASDTNSITVVGRVLDEAGDGIANADVVVNARVVRDFTRVLEVTGKTDETGAYAITLDLPEVAESPEAKFGRRRSSVSQELTQDLEDRAAQEKVARAAAFERLLEAQVRMTELEEQVEEQQAAREVEVALSGPASSQQWVAGAAEASSHLQALQVFTEAQLAGIRAIAETGLEEEITVRAFADGYQPAEPVVIDIPETSEVEVDVVLASAEPLEGVVVDRAGLPVVDADVRAVASLEGRMLPTTAVGATTDAEGRFRLAQLPPGTHCLTVRGAGVEPLVAWVETGPDLIEIVAERAGIVEITVVDEAGAPISGARVEWIRDRLSIANSMVGKGGSTRVDRLSPGPVLVRVYTRNHTYPVLERMTEISVGEQSLTLVVPAPTDVQGVLHVPEEFRADDGTIPRGRFLVAAYRSGGLLGSSSGSYAMVDPDGSFRVTELPPGDYVFAIARRSERGSMTIRSFQDVRLRSGDESLHLTYVDSPLAHLDIAVVTRGGEPVPGAKLEFVRARTGGRSDHRAGDDGTFSIDLHADPLDIVVEAPGFVSRTLSVRARSGETESLRAVLEPRPTLEEAVLRSLRGGHLIMVHEPLSARALLATIELLEPGAVTLDPALAASEVLDRWTASGSGAMPLQKLFLGLLREHAFAWESEGARIHLGLGKGLDER